MHFRSKVLISQRKVTPSQHAQTRKNQGLRYRIKFCCGATEV